MKSLLDVTHCVLLDCGALCGVNPNRDLITISRRVKDEGDSFLTITLPAFCSDFERSLAEGFFSPAHTSRFKSGSRTGLPRFLGGFLERIFDSSGVLYLEPDITAILAVRQICLLHKKVLLPTNRRRMNAAILRFVKNEDRIRNHAHHDALDAIFDRVSGIVWSDLVRGSPCGDPWTELAPKHGPGTTREGIRGNGKFAFASWPSRLEIVFPSSEFAISSILNDEGVELLSRLTYPAPRDEPPVKVVLVPKTLKTPRVIAIEPVAMQFMQQAVANWVQPIIEQKGRFTLGHVNFTDQTVNSQCARIGSVDGSFATLDMSDASDLVSCRLISRMLRVVPTLRRYIFASRSTRATLPTGVTMPLRKFASMGSALCFPMESMAFFIAIISSRLYRARVHATPRSIEKFVDRVHVYGDDLIVPADEAPSVIEDLESFGFKVNSAKSHWTGKFRESCGRDWYDGVDVTPVYFRRKIPDHRADSHGVISSVSFANQCYFAGLWGTVRRVRESIERLMGPLPSVLRETQVLGWNSFSNAVTFHAWHDVYQRPKVRCWTIVPRRRVDIIDGDAALLKCLRLVGTPTDERHLRESVRYGNLALKRRWI
jgi:hypothetical protein